MVKLERIESEDDGVRLIVSGIDAVDGTPVFDIKPYVPYADSVPDAEGGFASSEPERLLVEWECVIPNAAVQLLIESTLSLNPAPAYQDERDRLYRGLIADWNVTWKRMGDRIFVLSCSSLPADS